MKNATKHAEGFRSLFKRLVREHKPEPLEPQDESCPTFECEGSFELNVGQLGNITPQLHVHVIARFQADAAWPNPVWGRGERVPYGADAATALTQQIKTAMRLP